MAAYRGFYHRYSQLEARAGFGSSFTATPATSCAPPWNGKSPMPIACPDTPTSPLPLLKKQFLDPGPTYPWLEELKIGFWLSKTREYLTADDPAVKALLGREFAGEPGAHAGRRHEAGRPGGAAALLDGGMAAVAASQDPLIRFVLAHDALGARATGR